jgi:hypothetical protein
VLNSIFFVLVETAEKFRQMEEEICLTGMAPIGGAGPIRQEDDDRRERHALITGQALEEYKNYRKLLSDKQWVAVQYNGAEGISCFEMPTTFRGDGKEPVYTIKATGCVNGKTADQIARAHLDCNHSSRCGWDKELSDIGLLELVRSDENLGMALTVQYAEHTPVIPGVAKREFVYFQWSRRVASKKHKKAKNPAVGRGFLLTCFFCQDGVWEIIARHTDHPKKPVRSDPVRAHSMSVMILEPLTPEQGDLLLSPRTSVTIMAWVQPGGWVPDGVVALYKTKLADRIKFLRETSFFS